MKTLWNTAFETLEPSQEAVGVDGWEQIKGILETKTQRI